ncbi:tyrosine-protein phosphatase [Aquabacterium sp. A7-Y]|uniref:fused DSP-PTPase phosphatase/NAD kinase-like protein n=1 Tax=Aquabacterium sp. A7-Y TaxID=1349605 RepID=UPI00223DB6DA|nr:tyrosine-protein phosphatase [Aquabacterium sp. A7-Y]MCW7538466.1 tyrosine-protein phosphatase [Aquabacterium sp. A7-Y]
MNRKSAVHPSRRHCLALLALAPLERALAHPAASSPGTARPTHWAEPLTLPGVRNLHRLHAGLYRSEQPTAKGMAELYRLGVRTVINLRAFHSDDDEIAGTGLLNTRLRMNTWDVEDEHVVSVLRVLRQPDKGPFLIHCLHGADRTGLMSAMYRIVEQGWSKEQAIEEMMRGGYGWHSVWRNIPRYIRRTDVAALRRTLEQSQPLG